MKTCPQGHTFFKSSDCPVCPICENENKPDDGFLSALSAPARRALQRENINTLEELCLRTEEELLKLHGIGPSSIPKLRQELSKKGLKFKNL